MEKSARITGKSRDTAAATFKRKYLNGASIRSIAKAAGRSYGFVHRVLIESGVSMRERGGYMKKQRAGKKKG